MRHTIASAALLALAAILDLVLALVSVVDQSVDILDYGSELLLLSLELVMHPIEDEHEAVKLLVLSSVISLFSAIEKHELVLELLLRVFFALPLSVDRQEIGQLGTLLAVTNVDNDSHYHVLEGILSIIHIVVSNLGIFTSHHVVAGELSLLLQYLVLEDQKISTERLIFILLDKLFHLLTCQDQQLSVSFAPEVHIHVVLHEESPMVDH